MLGQRKSLIQVTNRATVDVVDEVKKVDIDIFKTGEEDVDSVTYQFKALSAGTPIENLFIDTNTGRMKFRIDVTTSTKGISSLVLDADTSITPQKVVDDLLTGLHHYEFELKLSDPSGTHTLNLQVVNYKTNNGKLELSAAGEAIPVSYENYLYKFHILVKNKNALKIVDIPQDTYQDALLNVAKLWLLSGKYDRVRHPDWAGFFDNHLRGYQMNDEGAKKVQEDLSQQIAAKIKDVLISGVEATPLPAERAWEVYVTATDMQTKLSTLSMNKKKASTVVSVDDDNIDNVTKLN